MIKLDGKIFSKSEESSGEGGGQLPSESEECLGRVTMRGLLIYLPQLSWMMLLMKLLSRSNSLVSPPPILILLKENIIARKAALASIEMVHVGNTQPVEEILLQNKLQRTTIRLPHPKLKFPGKEISTNNVPMIAKCRELKHLKTKWQSWTMIWGLQRSSLKVMIRNFIWSIIHAMIRLSKPRKCWCHCILASFVSGK